MQNVLFWDHNPVFGWNLGWKRVNRLAIFYLSTKILTRKIIFHIIITNGHKYISKFRFSIVTAINKHIRHENKKLKPVSRDGENRSPFKYKNRTLNVLILQKRAPAHPSRDWMRLHDCRVSSVCLRQKQSQYPEYASPATKQSTANQTLRPRRGGDGAARTMRNRALPPLPYLEYRAEQQHHHHHRCSRSRR